MEGWSGELESGWRRRVAEIRGGQCEETEEGRKRAGYWSLFELPSMFHHKIHKNECYTASFSNN